VVVGRRDGGGGKIVWWELGSRNLQLQICPANLH